MKTTTAFFHKELIELKRTGKLLILFLIFTLFGIMNPAIAKLTPWLVSTFADSFAEAGIIMTDMTVDALTSWTQFYKNVPMALIIFLLLFSNILTSEYQKGTLIPLLTKGLPRINVIVSKTLLLLLAWTCGYWLCYGITYAYNAFFWDNHIASHPAFAALCPYVLGIWLISLLMLMSTLFESGSAVITSTGGIFIALYLLSLLPRIQDYLPAKLLSSLPILYKTETIEAFLGALGTSAFLTIINLILSVLLFDKKRI
ncbi:ABC transporter permease subunit [Roseburia hominis]